MSKKIAVFLMALVILASAHSSVAQQAGKMPRIGFLWDSPAVFADAIEAFRQGLRDLGYVEG
ncbi:MAG: hypothetical protein AABZ64_17960, partial [Nitrospinota bacterium]